MKPTHKLHKSSFELLTPRRVAHVLAGSVLLALCNGPALAQVRHVVAEGDTLWSIAEQQLGAARLWPLIQKTNQLADPHRLTVGMALQLPTVTKPLQASGASVLFVHGEVWVSVPGAATAVVLRVGDQVPEGARIEVRDRGFVRLQLLDGSAFGLSAGSVAQLERLRHNTQSRQSQTVIRLLSGRVESDVVPRQHPNSRFDVHTPMAVASVRGTRFGVSASPDGVTSEVTQGRVAVRALQSRGQSTTLSAGQGAQVGRQGALQQAALLPAADLASLPAHWDEGDFVAFALPAQQQATAYRVRLQQPEAAGAVLSEAWVKDPAVALQSLDDGRYTLAVQALGPLGLLGAAAEHRFEVRSSPAAPLYRQPAAGARVSGDRLTLRCTEPMGVAGYRIQVATDAGFAAPLADHVVPDRCEQTVSLPSGRYFWRTASLLSGAQAQQGPFSQPSPFEVVGGSAGGASATGAETEQLFWTPRPGFSYRVQLAEDAGFTRMLKDDWLAGSQFALPSTGSEAVFMRWQARHPDGRTGRLSAVHRLTLKVAGLRTGTNDAVRAGEAAVGTGATPTPPAR